MTAINVFDITAELLDHLLPERGQAAHSVPSRLRGAVSSAGGDASAPGVELRLVRAYVRMAPTPRRDSHGIRTDLPRRNCPRCGIGYSAANPEAGDTCRDCTEVVDLINAEPQSWCNDTCA